jgi:hypothetical protein
MTCIESRFDRTLFLEHDVRSLAAPSSSATSTQGNALDVTQGPHATADGVL